MWYMYFSPGPEKKDWALNWRFAGSNPILPAMYDQAPNVIWVKISCVQCMCVYNDSYRWCFDALWWLPQHLAFYSEKMCLFITALNTPTSPCAVVHTQQRFKRLAAPCWSLGNGTVLVFVLCTQTLSSSPAYAAPQSLLPLHLLLLLSFSVFHLLRRLFS